MSKLDEVLKARTYVADTEIEKEPVPEFSWKEVPWYYRLQLFIANHLIIYTVFVFALGCVTALIAG